MINKHLKTLTRVLILTIFLTVLSTVAFAAESPSFELPVKVKLSGSPPADEEDYKIVLQADNPDYPMPIGSKDGIFTMTIRGENTVKFPEIEYSSLGIYTYKIDQLKGTNKLATYDDKSYHLVVYVTNAVGGSGLETTVLLYLVGEEGKLDEVIFENKYDSPSVPDKPDEIQPPDKPDVPKTGDDTVIWPYVGLLISGAAMLTILGFTIKKKKINE